ncbi:MAG: glutamine amidotransferase, partial [Persicimonas sp.]
MFDLSKYNAGDLLWLGDWSAGWIALLAVVGAIVIAISAYDLRNLSPARRWLLVGLRSVVYGLAVLVLLEPALDLKHVSKVRSDVAVLVDQSRSMSLKADKETDKTRAERSREALDELEPLFERKSEDHNFHFFHFGDSLESTSGKAAGKGEPDADASDLSGALEEVGDEIDRDNLGGIVLLSDGIATGAIGRRVARGEELDEATRQQLQSLDAPINTRAAASSEGLRDVAITDVLHDDFAFVHNKVSVDVRLQVIGMDKRTIPVQLRRDGELLQTRQISVDPDKTTYEVTFEFVPEQIGKEVYSVSTPEFSGEVLDENNIDHFLLNVIRDKIRVLQVVGEPNWDERFLRRHLKQNPNYDLVSFFILRTDSDVQQVPNDELSLIPFPTRELFEEELGSFDLVIFQNFAFGPYQMHQYLPHIADFVRDGGGFAMIGGEQSFGTGGYGGTPIEEILPVNLPQMGDSSDALDTREFNPELTEAGQTHPITQLAFDPDKNREIWADLPQMQGSNLVYPKSGATTLATHPDIEQGGEKMPMIAVDDIEEGRSMALAGDSSWRWKFRHVGEGGSSRRYEHFWNRAIRWLIRDPELKLINVDVADDIAPPGDDQEVTITISEPDYT